MMKEKNGARPLITVIVPVYNVESYLEKCIESVLNQTYTNLELILVNDGSTDNSGAVCDKYAEIDERVRVVHKDNEGPSVTRNRGLQEAEGDYLVFCDSDDILAKIALESMYSVMDRYNTDLVLCGYSKFGKSFDVTKETRILSNYSLTIFQSNKELASLYLAPKTNLFGISIWAKMYKMDIIRNNSIMFPPDTNYEEDCMFNLQYFKHIETAGALRDVLYFWRQHDTSITKSSYSSDNFLQLTKGFTARVDFIKMVGMADKIIKLQNIYLTVIMNNFKKIFFSNMSKRERYADYKFIMDIDEVVKTVDSCNLSKNRLTRRLTLATRAKNYKKLDRILMLWRVGSQIKKVKNFIKGISLHKTPKR